MARLFPFPNNPELIRERKQSQTVRKGWEHLHEGEFLLPVAQNPALLKPGEKLTPLLPKDHYLHVIRIDFVAVQDLTRLDVHRSGYRDWTLTMYQTHLMRLYDCGPLDVLTRIYFGYVQPKPQIILPGDMPLTMTVMPAKDSADRG